MPKILDTKNRERFISALNSLASPTIEDPFKFKGKLKKVSIVSKKYLYGRLAEMEGEEVEQRITINDKGGVWFYSYNYVNTEEEREKVITKIFRIEKASADRLLNAISYNFRNGFDNFFPSDFGIWEMELTNTDGTTYNYMNQLGADLYYEGTSISELIRDSLDMDGLFVFDGECSPDVINRISLVYHRVTKIEPDDVSEDADIECFTRDYTESLVIDRKTETIDHIQNIGTGCKASHRYQIVGGIESLLDEFDAEDLFYYVEGNPEDVVEDPSETKEYTITIDYEKGPQKVIRGTYDKKGLPEDFDQFIKKVFEFIRFYGIGEIFVPSNYGKIKRRKTEYIYCSVTFDYGYKSYYYITDDDSIEVGDLVIVPAGPDNHEVTVEVVDVEYFSKDEVPLPIEKTKKIIRKFGE